MSRCKLKSVNDLIKNAFFIIKSVYILRKIKTKYKIAVLFKLNLITIEKKNKNIKDVSLN